MWREYAKADRRWGGSDLTVVSLELLTVGLMAPVAVWVCCCLSRNSRIETRGLGGSEWFWMVVLATGELYGGEYCVSSPFVSLLSGGGSLEKDGLETGKMDDGKRSMILRVLRSGPLLWVGRDVVTVVI